MASPSAEEMLSFRPAEEGDLEFIWSLRMVTMKPVIELAYGWDEATQREYARESLAGRIVLLDGIKVGVLTVADWERELHLVWMAVDPSRQGRGVGTKLVLRAQQEAAARGLPLTLQVLRINPAIRLYERLGFVEYDENGPHKILMRWSGTGVASSSIFRP